MTHSSILLRRQSACCCLYFNYVLLKRTRVLLAGRVDVPALRGGDFDYAHPIKNARCETLNQREH